MKNCVISTTSFFFFVLFFNVSFAQIYDGSFSPTAESIRSAPVPNSPEAQAFAKYGNTPVNMYTGTPNIDIPLYTHQGRELNLPISLSYDASGIKVEQLATTVGLGWNLNVGGRISRITNGLPDDFHPGVNTYDPYKSYWDNEVKTAIELYDDLPSNPTFSDPNGKQKLLDYMYFLKKTDRNEYDTQPDYFSFNALGVNDMFVIEVSTKQGKALNNPRIKVEFNKTDVNSAAGAITQWTITLDNGTKLTFDQAEVTIDLNMQDTGGSGETFYGFKKEYNSSWLLTKIESPNLKDTYDFEYTSLGFWSSNRTGSVVTGVTNIIAIENGAPNNNNSPTPTNVMGYKNYEYTIDQLLLSTIKHNTKRIVSIDLLNDRWDMDIDSAIENINIYKKDSNNHSADLYKAYTLNYDYFRTQSGVSAPPYNSSSNNPNPILIRLMLESIDIKDKNEAIVSDYEFEYIEPYSIASTTSASQDYYGYYNGANNTVLYPSYSHTYVPSGGADRDPNFNYAKRGLLNKITYPTGGHTIFEYESNKEREINGTSLTWQTETTVTLNNPSLPTFDINACNTIYGTSPFDEVTPAVASNVFEITQNQQDVKVIYDTDNNIKNYSIENAITIVKIPDANSSLSWTQIFDSNCGAISGVDVVWSETISRDGLAPIYPKDFYTSLSSGHYQIVLSNPYLNVDASVEIQKGTTNPTYTYNEKAGLRVKSIKDYTDTTTLASHKSYEYPSGTVISQPRYTYTSTQYSKDANNQMQQSTILHRLSYTKGTDKPHIGYASVIEKQLNASSQYPMGETAYEFYTTNHSNYRSGAYTYYINGKETSNQYGVTYQLGKSKGSAGYDTNDNMVSSSSTSYEDEEFYSNTSIYMHIDENRNELYPVPIENTTVTPHTWSLNYLIWEIVPTLYSPSIGIGSIDQGATTKPPAECIDVSIWGSVAIGEDLCKPNIGRLLKRDAIARGKAGVVPATSSITDGITSTTSNDYYDNASVSKYLLKESSTTNSLGETLKQQYDYPLSGPLKDKNILNVPIKTTYFNDSNKIFTKETLFTGTLPSSIKTARGTSTLETRVEFERYVDENLVQSKVTNGPTSAFIWGYDNRYVVAKVENATFLEIEGIFGNNFNAGASGLTSSQEISLRNGLPNAMITTYTYEPIVGVASMTDPKGYTITYHYDSANRLESVKDADGNILSNNTYNYKQ